MKNEILIAALIAMLAGCGDTADRATTGNDRTSHISERTRK